MSTPVRYTASTMQRGRWHKGKRWLAALLTLLAAFAFPVRGPLMAPQTALPSERQAAPATGSMHLEHAGAAAHADHSTAPDHHPQNHQAHCLFCLTGAFALQADTAAPLPAPVVHTAPATPLAVQSRAPALRHADARAPPHRA